MTADDVQELARELLVDENLGLCIIGPVDERRSPGVTLRITRGHLAQRSPRGRSSRASIALQRAHARGNRCLGMRCSDAWVSFRICGRGSSSARWRLRSSFRA